MLNRESNSFCTENGKNNENLIEIRSAFIYNEHINGGNYYVILSSM